MESVIIRSENPFTKPLIVIVMMAIVLLGAMTLAHAVKRHGQVVHEVVKTCGPATGGSQVYMHNSSTKRNAGACLVQGQWWIVIDGEPIDGDNIVSVFPRKTAQSIDDMLELQIQRTYHPAPKVVVRPRLIERLNEGLSEGT